MLADHAPDLSTALERAAAAGCTHLNLDGTVIRTDRVAAPGPNGADLWWSGKHRHHGGNAQVVSAPDGWPVWVSPVRPGREHDTTCARTHGLITALNRLAATLGIPTLTDLGYENAGEGFRHPVKKLQGRELGLEQKAFNKVIRGIHSVAERANALLKVTFKALRRVSLDLACRTRAVWQCQRVPSLSGLLSALTGISRLELPPASPCCCDSTAAESSHLRSIPQRLVAHEVADPDP